MFSANRIVNPRTLDQGPIQVFPTDYACAPQNPLPNSVPRVPERTFSASDNRPIYPFKLAVFTLASGNWDKSEVTIFDCVEDPLPPETHGTNFLLLHQFAAGALKAINLKLTEINADNRLVGLNREWMMKSIHIQNANGIISGPGFSVVYSLVGRAEIAESFYGSDSNSSLASMSRTGSVSGLATPTSTALSEYDRDSVIL
ncbi:hypothetical protein ABW19_dt0201332 [Dactylella cylindrospora]|nr:hypothetical protein ABW19_dt0201332 [Dactylella cylindrospora]